jgi:hypothetical protein
VDGLSGEWLSLSLSANGGASPYLGFKDLRVQEGGGGTDLGEG